MQVYFKQKCFMRKNSKKIREKLISLGYSNGTATNYGRHFIVTGIEYTVDSEPRYQFRSYKNYNHFYDYCRPEYIEKEYVDCGTNEKLFFAIAALTDNNDYMQWFVCNYDYLTYQMKEHYKGEFMICDSNKASINKIKPQWHKATVKELIEHFK